MVKHNHLEFNDGIISIYGTRNAAEEGERPREEAYLKRKCRYKNRTVGMARFYEAMQNQIKLDAAVLIPQYMGADVQDLAVIGEKQYKIKQVQQKTDTKPYTTLLSLSLIEESEGDTIDT